jgi:signal transduction histidine kinase
MDTMEIKDFYAYLDHFVNKEDGKGLIQVIKKAREFCERSATTENWVIYYGKILPSSREWDLAFFEAAYPEAISYLEEVDQMSEAIGLYLQKSFQYQEHEVSIDSAMLYSNKALAVAKDSFQHAIAYYMLARTVSLAHKDEEALEYMKKSMAYDPNDVWVIYELAWAFYELERIDSAIVYMKKTLEKAELTKEERGIKHALSDLTSFSIEQNHLNEDIPKNIAKLEALADSSEMRFSSSVYVTKGQYFEKLKQYDLAIKAYEKARWYSLNRPPKPDYNGIAEIDVLLSELYVAKGDYKRAFTYFKKGQQRLDSINNATIVSNLNDLELKYQTEKKEQKIALLNKDNALLNSQNRLYIAAALGIALLALTIGFFFINLRKKNKQITEQKAQLEQLNLTKDHLFAIIGHDLRKPTLAFRGIAKKVNYLLKNQDYKRLNRLGDEIERNAISMNKMTDNLLSWALMQKNAMPHQPSKVAINSIIDEVVALFQPLIEQKQIEIAKEIDPQMMVYADPDGLKIIVRNLIDNAIKFSPEGGRINMNVHKEKTGLKLQIKDNGVGMEQKRLDSIFLLQKNKSQRGTAGEKGTGLGLHIVHELVSKNKGAIKAISKLGQGTTFEVSFPLAT